MTGEFIKPIKQKPAITGTIADADEYNQNIAGQNKDSFLCIDEDGNYIDGDMGDETIVSLGNGGKTGVLFKNIKLRDGLGLIKVYDDDGILVRTINFDQATETQLGTAEIATAAEVAAGTDDFRFVTPLKLKNNAPTGGLKSVQTFTSSGTWTKPAGVNKVIVELVGGGGAGGFGASGGAGAGGYSKKFISSGLGSTETVTIGAGGLATGAGNGNNGGSTSFGSHLSATGGQGGGGSGFEGGIGSNGNINLRGERGNAPDGNGGASYLSASAHYISPTGQPGLSYGGGASRDYGAGSLAHGANGFVIVWEYS